MRSAETNRSNSRPDAYRIDAGDAEHVANGAVRRAAASLAENALRSREANDAVHGQEIRGVVELRDQLQLVPQLPVDIFRQPLRIALRCALPDQLLQMSAVASAPDLRLLRILVAKIAQSENRQRSTISSVRATASG